MCESSSEFGDGEMASITINGENFQSSSKVTINCAAIACEMCDNYKANAEKAWNVTASYADLTARANKNEYVSLPEIRDKLTQAKIHQVISQLRRIIDENRLYIDQQRKSIDELKDQLNQKHQQVAQVEEKLVTSRFQYQAILEKANELKSESQRNLNAASEWRLKFEKSQEVLTKVNQRRENMSQQLQTALNIAQKYKKKLEDVITVEARNNERSGSELSTGHGIEREPKETSSLEYTMNLELDEKITEEEKNNESTFNEVFIDHESEKEMSPLTMETANVASAMSPSAMETREYSSLKYTNDLEESIIVETGNNESICSDVSTVHGSKNVMSLLVMETSKPPEVMSLSAIKPEESSSLMFKSKLLEEEEEEEDSDIDLFVDEQEGKDHAHVPDKMKFSEGQQPPIVEVFNEDEPMMGETQIVDETLNVDDKREETEMADEALIVDEDHEDTRLFVDEEDDDNAHVPVAKKMKFDKEQLPPTVEILNEDELMMGETEMVDEAFIVDDECEDTRLVVDEEDDDNPAHVAPVKIDFVKAQQIVKIFSARFFEELRALSFIAPLDAASSSAMQPPPVAATPQEVQKQLGIKSRSLGTQGLVIHDIVRAKNVSRTEAAMLAPDYYRSVAAKKKENSSREKAQVKPSEMPWQPSKNKLLRFSANEQSVFSKQQHRRYVAIVSNLLRRNPCFRFEENNKLEIKGMDQKLVRERQRFEQIAFEQVPMFKPPLFFVSRNNFDHWKSKMLARFDLELPKEDDQGRSRKFDVCVKTIDWPHDAFALGPTIVVECIATSDVKSLRKIALPDVRRRHQFPNPSIRGKKKTSLPIAKDEAFLDCAFSNDVEFVFDSGTLRHFLSAPCPARPEDFATQVTIIRRIHERTIKRLCIVGRPVLASAPSKPSICRQMVKWSVKHSLLADQTRSEYNAMPPPSLGEASTSSHVHAGSQQQRFSLVKFGDSIEHSVLLRCKPYALVCKDDDHVPPQNDEQRRGVFKWQNSKRAHSTTQPPSESGKNDDDLDRFSIVSFSAKPEFLPSIGAEMLHAEEQIWNYFTSTLKGSTEHIAIRVEPYDRFLLQIEHQDAKQFLPKLPNDTRDLIHARAKRFCSLLDALKSLDFGTFLVRTNNESRQLKIYGSSSDGCGDSSDSTIGGSDLHQECDVRAEIGALLKALSPNTISSVPIETYWSGLSAHVPLAWHIVQGRIPGSLPTKN